MDPIQALSGNSTGVVATLGQLIVDGRLPAAERLAERRIPPAVRTALSEYLAEGAAVLAKGHLVDEDIGRWSRLNQRLHDTPVHAHESRVIADAIAHNKHLPFASADSIARDRAGTRGWGFATVRSSRGSRCCADSGGQRRGTPLRRNSDANIGTTPMDTARLLARR